MKRARQSAAAPGRRTAPLGSVSLERAFSKLGAASRSEARRWIMAGRVEVNGRIVRDPGVWIVPERAGLRLDGRPLSIARSRIVLLFHKPRGCVTTRVDPEGRSTVYDFLGESPDRVNPVGRLDFASSGLLLFTNDGRLGDWLTDPESEILRVYAVTIRGEIRQAELNSLAAGVVDRGARLRTRSVTLRKGSKRESHLTIELVEGRNREIRRLFAAIGRDVTRLKRVAFGALTLGELPPGHFRSISEDELRRAFPDAPAERFNSVLRPSGRRSSATEP